MGLCEGTLESLMESTSDSDLAESVFRQLLQALDYLSWPLVAGWSGVSFWSHLTTFVAELVHDAAPVSLQSGSNSESELGRPRLTDIDGTEALVVALLLPRCRAVHTYFDGRPRKQPWPNCRCADNAHAVEEMLPLLDFLKR